VLSLSLPVQIFLCVLPTDMRRGFDGLMRMAEEHLQQNVLDGGLFVFVNRRRDRVKLLYWDGDGLCIWYKRLESGTVELAAAPHRCEKRCYPGVPLPRDDVPTWGRSFGGEGGRRPGEGCRDPPSQQTRSCLARPSTR